MVNKQEVNRVVLGVLMVCMAVAFGCKETKKAPLGTFTHGVASGDPGKEDVILWTRFVPVDSLETNIDWEIGSDSLFSRIVNKGSILSSPDNDFCVHVRAGGLQSGKTYYYRFKKNGLETLTGRTRTLPEKADNIRIGVVNCANYTGGYYHAFDSLSKMKDIDVVIHLGDYIYEGGKVVEGSSYWPSYKATGRQHDPMHECFSLTDYRTRYALYRGDSALQKLHSRFPMIPIWDDHEIAMKPLNKNKPGYAKFGGTWQERFDNSVKAYHEWLPLRPKAFETIYRSFQFGDLVNLMMLDTRVCCKSEVTKTPESLLDTTRHIIGSKQLKWIQEEVIQNDADWNVFGNQLLLAIKDMGWARWPGFPRDRDRFLDFVQRNPEKNFVFTTGNAHNPHHYIIRDETKRDTLVHEFLPGSISSGNNAEKAFYDPDVLAKEAKRLTEAENVLWFHQDSHGFIVLDITEEKLEALWYFVSSIRDKTYTVNIPYRYTLRSNQLE
ncbi:MAG: alkaline phosphatase D family protein [Bacteroidota bacterium]